MENIGHPAKRYVCGCLEILRVVIIVVLQVVEAVHTDEKLNQEGSLWL